MLLVFRDRHMRRTIEWFRLVFFFTGKNRMVFGGVFRVIPFNTTTAAAATRSRIPKSVSINLESGIRFG